MVVCSKKETKENDVHHRGKRTCHFGDKGLLLVQLPQVLPIRARQGPHSESWRVTVSNDSYMKRDTMSTIQMCVLSLRIMT